MAFCTTGCKEPEPTREYFTQLDYIFVNESEHHVEDFAGYFSIPAGDQRSISFEYSGPKYLNLEDVESAANLYEHLYSAARDPEGEWVSLDLIKFDDEHCLNYDYDEVAGPKDVNSFERDRKGDRHLVFTYRLTEELYEAAVPCGDDVALTDIEFRSIRDLESQVRVYVNWHRGKVHKPMFETLKVFHQQAVIHSENMANGTVPFGHEGFDERARAIIEVLGEGEVRENVARGFKFASSVVQVWLDSPADRSNIEGDFKYSDVGVYQSPSGEYFFTQLFF